MYGYPNYNPYQGQMYQQPLHAMQPMQPKDDRIWVQGEVGQKAYMVVPGVTVPLWDSESKRIWLKTGNASGPPFVQEITYNFVGEQPQMQTDFESRFASIEKRLDALEPKKEVVVND